MAPAATLPRRAGSVAAALSRFLMASCSLAEPLSATAGDWIAALQRVQRLAGVVFLHADFGRELRAARRGEAEQREVPLLRQRGLEAAHRGEQIVAEGLCVCLRQGATESDAGRECVQPDEAEHRHDDEDANPQSDGPLTQSHG